MASPAQRDHRSTFDSVARSFASRNRDWAIGHSSRSCGEGKNQHDVEEGKDHEAVSEGQMNEQPKFQGLLEGVMIIESIPRTDEVAQLFQSDALAFAEVAAKLLDFVHDRIQGATGFKEVRPETTGASQEGA